MLHVATHRPFIVFTFLKVTDAIAKITYVLFCCKAEALQ